MPFIRVINEDEAEGELFRVYDDIQRTRGRVANVLRIQSLRPKGLKTHLDLYMDTVFGRGPLSRRQREVVAVVVSAVNGCDYCITHHGEALNKYVKDPKWVKALAADPEGYPLEPAERALADYAIDLTRNPAQGRREAVERLRKAGFDDAAILHVTEVAAYFNYVNRLVHGLGVELEEEQDRDYVY